MPRSKLPEVLSKVYEIADRHDLQVLNVFHAGDGNLHPLLVFDARVPGTTERVHLAGEEIVRASVESGGVLSGEHGIGLEKKAHLHRTRDPREIDVMRAIKRSLDPKRLLNPGKVFDG